MPTAAASRNVERVSSQPFTFLSLHQTLLSRPAVIHASDSASESAPTARVLALAEVNLPLLSTQIAVFTLLTADVLPKFKSLSGRKAYPCIRSLLMSPYLPCVSCLRSPALIVINAVRNSLMDLRENMQMPPRARDRVAHNSLS